MARTRRPQDTESDNVVNDERRKEIELALDALSDARTRLEDVMREEQDSHDNLPDGIRDSDRGEAMETSIAYMDDAIGEIESAETNVDYAKKGVAE